MHYVSPKLRHWAFGKREELGGWHKWLSTPSGNLAAQMARKESRVWGTDIGSGFPFWLSRNEIEEEESDFILQFRTIFLKFIDLLCIVFVRNCSFDSLGCSALQRLFASWFLILCTVLTLLSDNKFRYTLLTLFTRKEQQSI